MIVCDRLGVLATAVKREFRAPASNLHAGARGEAILAQRAALGW